MVERHRHVEQRSVYLQKTPDDANLTEEELREIVKEDGERFQKLLGRMSSFNANVKGSNAALYKARQDLEALMEQKGVCTIWFSLSAADNHWHDLHKLLYDKPYPPDSTSEEQAAIRRKMVRDNPHIVDAYFHCRVKDFLSTHFGKGALEASYWWFRIEYQGRGTAHAHGCLQIKNAPDLIALSEAVLLGRIAARTLNSLPIPLDFQPFDEADVEHDVWVPEVEDPDKLQPTQDEIDEMLEQIKAAHEAHAVIVKFHDFLLSTVHPDPPSDASENVRFDETIFDPGAGVPHPSARDPQYFIILFLLASNPGDSTLASRALARTSHRRTHDTSSNTRHALLSQSSRLETI